MTSLIDRLHALTGPDREIDAEIALANGWTTGGTTLGAYWCGPEDADRTCEVRPQPPHFTARFDAALTLMPPDPPDQHWRVRVERYSDGWYAMIELRIAGGPIGPEYRGDQAPTPAIALLIAIMKAKEKSTP